MNKRNDHENDFANALAMATNSGIPEVRWLRTGIDRSASDGLWRPATLAEIAEVEDPDDLAWALLANGLRPDSPEKAALFARAGTGSLIGILVAATPPVAPAPRHKPPRTRRPNLRPKPVGPDLVSRFADEQAEGDEGGRNA